MASAAVPAMSSAPASSGGGEGAPAAQPGGGAGPQGPGGLAGAIESIFDEPQRHAPQPQQARTGETQQQQQSRLEALIASLPQEDQAAARAEFNHLRTQAGRVAAAERRAAEQPQAESGEISHEQRLAEAAMIAAVTAQPQRLHELAAMAGVEPEVLAKAAGIQGGAAPGQNQITRDPRVLADPGLFPRVFAEFELRANPEHAESWSKPLLDLRNQADEHRGLADRYAMEARIAETQQAKDDFTRLAKQSRDTARNIELKADQHIVKQVYGLMNVLNKMFHERVSPFEKLAEAAQAKDAQESKMQGQRQTMVNAAATVLAPEGHALFGPKGYGIFDVDAAGNVTAVSDAGAEVLEAAEEKMLEYNLPMDAAGLARALHLLSLESTYSDGASGNPAGARSGGATGTLPAGAPGSFGTRPSLAGDIMQTLSPGRY